MPLRNKAVKSGSSSSALLALSPEALDTVREMVRYCIQHGACMGPDEGWHEITGRLGDPIRTRKRKFRKEIESFADYANVERMHPYQQGRKGETQKSIES